MKRQITFMCLLLLLLTAIPIITIPPTSAALPSDVEYPQWLASVSADDCDGPTDSEGRSWHDVDFDDSGWELVSPPLINDIGLSEDRYYRTVYTPSPFSKMYLDVASDDGIWLYVNGQFVGHWGGECHDPGCVGDVPWDCEVSEDWIDVDVSQYLQAGHPNVIAAHVTNYSGHSGDWSYFSLRFFPEALVFDLPIDYEGRSQSDREEFYRQLQFQMTSLFDHSPAGDGILQPFTGQTLANPGGVHNCQLGINCYDGHLAWDFDDKDNNIAVFAAAEGDIVPEKTGCFDGDDCGCRVCIEHGEAGYSTVYCHLRNSGFMTSGHVTKDDQIGFIGETGAAFGTHLHFATFFNPDSPCEFGTEVDLSGWLPTSKPDPRESATGLKSIPLWVHPLSMSTLVQPGAPAVLSWHDLDTRIEMDTRSYTRSLQMMLAPAPNPPHNSQLAGTGHTFYLVASDIEGEVTQLDLPMRLQVGFDQQDLIDVWPDSLSIYQFDSQTQEWVALLTEIGYGSQAGETHAVVGTANAETQSVAPFALLGLRMHKIYLPMITKSR